MREALRLLDAVINQLLHQPDSMMMVVYLELVRDELMARANRPRVVLWDEARAAISPDEEFYAV